MLLSQRNTLITPVQVCEKRVGVAVVCLFQDTVLTCMRKTCRDMNGLWQFPGGAIEDGELAYTAAVRELWEETYISVDAHLLLHSLGTWVGQTNDGSPNVTTFFLVRLIRRPIAHNTDSRHGLWEWLTIDELLKRPMIEVMRPVLGIVNDLKAAGQRK